MRQEAAKNSTSAPVGGLSAAALAALDAVVSEFSAGMPDGARVAEACRDLEEAAGTAGESLDR
ncbi:MAG: hypothetical protein WC943_13230, partial [Elusimicrobiota bacterium]